MNFSAIFFLNNIFLGVGLAMDAFSVSMANGLNEPKMRHFKIFAISGCFSFFQFLMPMIGWICVHSIVNYFSAFQKFVPWIALILLLYIGLKMIIEGLKKSDDDDFSKKKLTFGVLLIQGIATSIDALSVGFTIADYNFLMALISSIIIALVTFLICLLGLKIGKIFGTKLENKANILGGVILIFIGIEIFTKGAFS